MNTDRRMGGRFCVLPFDVIEKIKSINYKYSLELYVTILSNVIIEEDWEYDEIWVSGKFQAKKIWFIEKFGYSKHPFMKAWSELEEANLIKKTNNPDEYILTQFKKKSDSFIQPSEIARLNTRIIQLEKSIQELTEKLKNNPQDPGNLPQENPEKKFAKKLTNVKNFALPRAPGAPKRAPGAPKRAPGALGTSLFKDLEKNRSEDDEGKNKVANNSVKKKREILEGMILNLWPGRSGFFQSDEEYIAVIEKYRMENIAEAFRAAADANVSYGRYSWIINRLRNPGYYREGKKPKRTRSNKTNLSGNDHVFGLEASWLNDEGG